MNMDDLLGLAFAGLAVVFSVWNFSILVKYRQFRSLAPSSILSWETPRPWFLGLCLGIGFFMIAMTFFSGFILHRPALHTVAQGLMAVFYTVVFPMSFRIRRGFYASGIWAERRFLPYQEIRWHGWRERPEIVLGLRGEDRFLRQGYDFLRKGRRSSSASAAKIGFFARVTIFFASPVTTTVRRDEF